MFPLLSQPGNRSGKLQLQTVQNPGIRSADLALFSTGDAGAYALVFQSFYEPVGVIATISEQPFDLLQAFERCPCANVITDLTSGDEEVERAAFAVADGVQPVIHAALGAPNQTSAPPFFTLMLVAVL